MAEVKMTKVAKFNAIMDMVGADATFEDGTTVAEFLNHEIEITNKRNARKSSKPSAKETANAEIAEKMVELLKENEKMTASEIAKALDLSSPQKVVGVVRNYAKDTITTEKDKRVTYYTLIA